ncbi:ABC transporter permease [Novosphingobium profundi]|uniref:ABC transporter permease n=1 Tax=Novosphingobium profundi TaxID=1774954 RepID=UPI001CFEB926|nr:ABC transporter permease [Novosphingobium profundi]
MDVRGKPSLLRSLNIERRVVSALLMREVLTRYGRHNIGFLWLFVEPMLFTVGVATLWSLLSSFHGSDLPIVDFAMTGYSCVLVWRNVISRAIGAIEPNLALLHHRNVKPFDIMLARALLEVIGAGMSFFILTLLFYAIGWSGLPEDILKVLGGWILLAWLGCSAGILLGAMAFFSEIVDKIWHPMAYIMFPISGAAFTVDALPSQFQNVVLWIPMVSGTELVREGFFGSRYHAHYDVFYVIAVCTLMTLLGLALTRKLSREIEPG